LINSLFTRVDVIARFNESPLHFYLSDLAQKLDRQGYSRDVIRRHLCAGEKFGRWLTANKLTPSDVNEPLAKRYVAEQWPHRADCGRQEMKAHAGLMHLVRILRERRVILDASVELSHSPAHTWLCGFEKYLVQVAGAKEGTCKRYMPIARRFIEQTFGDGTLQWGTVTADHVTAFVTKEAATKRGFGRRAAPVAIRAVIRFLVSSGDIRVGLDAAIPTMRSWKHAALPRHISHDLLDRVLADCRDSKPSNHRNLAIVLLLARLGIRADEVIKIQMEDIDWRNARICIRPGKNHTERVLPLLQEIGDALAQYLSEARPHSDSRRVFLSHRPPFHPLAGSSAISVMAKRALLGNGFKQSRLTGSHNFRHTVASTMVSNGATFKDVADVLGHHSIETTGIYAKLDLKSLATVALPWKGDAK
jgi:site-specific recombinase XerD